MKKSWNPLNAWVRFTRKLGWRRSSVPVRSTTLESSDRVLTASTRPRVALATPDRPVKGAQISVVLPMYNEQAEIVHTVNAIQEYIQTHPQYTFIFVNDGSSDRSKDILTTLIKRAHTKQIQLISYQPRAGKGFAVKTGIELAEGDYICYLDSDLAYSLEHLDALVAKLRTTDVVIGSRSLTSNSVKGLKWSRKLAGKVFNWLSRGMLGLPYCDMQAGLKGFRKQAAKALFAKQELTGFSFDVELIYLAKKWGYSIAEIPAKVSDKHQQKVSNVNLIQDSLRMLGDLLKIRLNDFTGRYR